MTSCFNPFQYAPSRTSSFMASRTFSTSDCPNPPGIKPNPSDHNSRIREVIAACEWLTRRLRAVYLRFRSGFFISVPRSLFAERLDNHRSTGVGFFRFIVRFDGVRVEAQECSKERRQLRFQFREAHEGILRAFVRP